MNDDLNLLITFVSMRRTIDKVALNIEHGMNNDVIPDWEHIRGYDMAEKYTALLPSHISEDIDFIISIEEISYVGSY